ncbi:hypothetical protein MMC07_000612 [Pseudocyphellaria aurata]|nr:hypothetical protein [Pseudocyphellaria aurata]
MATDPIPTLPDDTRVGIYRSTFSTLPAEIHDGIAQQCEINDLFNLCLTSKRMNEIFTRALYLDVDLDRDRLVLDADIYLRRVEREIDARQRQRRFIQALEKHPEHGRYVRSFRGSFPYSGFGKEGKNWDDLWLAIELLTHVQRVEVGSRTIWGSLLTTYRKQIPCALFQSATSVTLVGDLEYNLAKSILKGINPAALKYLCLNMVRDPNLKCSELGPRAGDIAEDGRVAAWGATSGLLTMLTGRCTTIRTLILRRKGQIKETYGWNDAAEDASYTEWASFLGSVQSTLEKFTFEQAASWWGPGVDVDSSSRIMDGRFRRLVLPTIVSGRWPCLNIIELQGVRSQDGAAGLTTDLRAVLGAQTTIIIKERPVYVQQTSKSETFEDYQL